MYESLIFVARFRASEKMVAGVMKAKIRLGMGVNKYTH